MAVTAESLGDEEEGNEHGGGAGGDRT